MSYHVGVSNIFELLEDENDEQLPGTKSAVKQETPQNKNKAVKETSAPQQLASTKPKQQPSKNEKANDFKAKPDNRSPKTDKVEKKPTKGGESGGVSASEGEDADKKRRQVRQGSSEKATDRRRPDRPPREQQSQQGSSSAPVAAPVSSSGGGGGGGGSGGRVKRVYERRSGTGRGREGKKGGSGRGNWGTAADDQSAQVETPEQEEEGTSQSKAETAKAEPVAPAPETEEERKEREEREKDEKAIDLQEFKKIMEEKAPKIPLPEPRKAEESSWDGFVVLQHEQEDDAAAKQKAKKGKEGSKEAKKQVPVDQIFNVQGGEQRQQRGGGFRKGNPNSNKKYGNAKRPGKASAPSFDASSFPALSTKA